MCYCPNPEVILQLCVYISFLTNAGVCWLGKTKSRWAGLIIMSVPHSGNCYYRLILWLTIFQCMVQSMTYKILCTSTVYTLHCRTCDKSMNNIIPYQCDCCDCSDHSTPHCFVYVFQNSNSLWIIFTQNFPNPHYALVNCYVEIFTTQEHIDILENIIVQELLSAPLKINSSDYWYLSLLHQPQFWYTSLWTLIKIIPKSPYEQWWGYDLSKLLIQDFSRTFEST